MIDIVIPYIDNFSHASELRFALRSIEKNLLGDYRIVIVGEPPTWIRNVKPIKKRRISIGSGSNLNDVICKMLMIVEDESISESFIRWYDDIYLLRPAMPVFFDQHFSLGRFSLRKPHDAQVYLMQLWETWQELKKNRLPEFNCEVHMPRVLERGRLKEIIYRHIQFCGKRKLLLFQSLYFNTFKPERHVVILKKEDQIKAGFYGIEDQFSFHTNDYSRIADICRDKFILNHNDKGLTPALNTYIGEQFPNKSYYEK